MKSHVADLRGHELELFLPFDVTGTRSTPAAIAAATRCAAPIGKKNEPEREHAGIDAPCDWKPFSCMERMREWKPSRNSIGPDFADAVQLLCA